MEANRSTKPSHKAWRRLAKKERRRRLRRQAAAEWEADEERLRAALERSAEYLNWTREQEREAEEREKREQEEHDERERQWLEEEARAQKEWQALQERKTKARQQQLEQEAKIREEFEAKQEAIRKKQEEEKRKREEDIRKREELLKEIDDYIDSGIKTPEALREVIDSQPGKELCPFFTKTGACRYGDTCSRNHRRVCLSKVILVPGFYSHFSLEKNSAEYDTDVALEFESSETRQHFREFYKDVVPELESFGRIKTLKYCCNTEVHLRGNLYVEYYTEREAARAMRRLKGRWYAGRQLNCEFANLKSWRSAVCGMAKCPKGRACNFLHTFKNPHDEYDIKSPPRWSKQSASNQEATSSRRSDHRNKSKWEDPLPGGVEEEKNWRWSESPEVEVEHRSSRNAEKRRHRSIERDHYQKSSRDRRHDHSERIKTSENESSSKRRRSDSKKHLDERIKGEEDVGRDSKGYSRKSRRNREQNDDYEDSKSSRRSQKNYSNGGSRHRSFKSDRHTGRHSRHQSHDHQSARRKSRRHGDVSHGSSRRKGDKTSRRLTEETTEATKSKWDKEESEESSAEDTQSSDSDSSGTTEGSSEASTTKRGRKRSVEKGNDQWTTTDSENEEKTKER